MQFIRKNGVSLAYEDINPGSPPVLFVHGWGCDHSIFSSQANYFSHSYRVVSVDLRGHGKSDAPLQDYTMAGYADDLAWLCGELALRKPIVVGHSMGGNVAMEFAARHPEIPASIILIDSVIFPHQAFLQWLRPLEELLRGPNYIARYQQVMLSSCLTTDEARRKTQLISSLPKAPRHVLASTLANHLTKYDAFWAAGACRGPVAYIGSAVLTADLARLRKLIPQLVTAQTLGSGHFSPLFVPDQINEMLSTFLQICAPPPPPSNGLPILSPARLMEREYSRAKS